MMGYCAAVWWVTVLLYDPELHNVEFLPTLGAFAKLRKGDCELRRARPSVRNG